MSIAFVIVYALTGWCLQVLKTKKDAAGPGECITTVMENSTF